MTKEDGQGDCFVPRNDGKSPMVHHSLNEGTTSRWFVSSPWLVRSPWFVSSRTTKPWFVQKSDDTPFPEMKEPKLIRQCEKIPEEKVSYFTKCLNWFSWQSSKARAPH